MNQYIEYAKHIGADEHLLKWVSTVLKNELTREAKTTEEVEHVLDYMVQCKKKVQRMSYKDAKKLSDAWLKTQIKKGNNIVELPTDTEIVLDFKDGFKVVKLVGENAYKREGFLMSHCVGSYFGRDVEIYSLRDKDNVPHCTMERDQQIKGKGNGDIHPKYINYVVKFLEHIGMTVGDSEMKHLGYINVEKIKDDLAKDTVYFNDKYVLQDAKLIDKYGNEYLNLDLLDIRPLINNDAENTLKVSIDIPMLCKLSFEWIQKKTRGIFKKSGKDNIVDDCDYSQVATSGDYSKVTTSGHSSKVATSGDYSKVATSGNSSKVATSGDYSKVATSGHYSQVATSGHYSQVATSGHYSQVATSGDYSQVATSGDYSKVATSGDDSVCANIGINGKIKGIKGNWITLAEYEYSSAKGRYIPLCVKSVQIDGQIIKEDTWYKLVKGEFTEAEND